MTRQERTACSSSSTSRSSYTPYSFTMTERRVDTPRSNRDPAEVARKVGLLAEPHVEPLTELVARIREERGHDRVPDFDPTEAGINAPILLLLEAPGPKATRERGGSGFVSPDNDDGTAENMWHLLRDAQISRQHHVVTWNIVPWYIGSATKIRPAQSADLLDGRVYTEQLLSLLPQLRVVVLLGKQAALGWSRLHFDMPTIEAPHPSPQNLNPRPKQRQQLLDALIDARRYTTA